jgi:hypothetical protein
MVSDAKKLIKAGNTKEGGFQLLRATELYQKTKH